MTTRYFKVTHKAGAFIDGVFYPPASDTTDLAESIVPLELKKGDKEPRWGVEVDVHGNEIGTAQRSAREDLGDALANKIAGNDGNVHVGHRGQNISKPADAQTGSEGAGAAPTGDKKEAEERAATIRETLDLLDHKNDEQWTSAGQPKVDVVEDASGLENLTRKEIEEAAPDFKREEQK